MTTPSANNQPSSLADIDRQLREQSIRTILRSVNDSYNNRIVGFLKGDFKDKSPLYIGYPSQVLVDCGFPPLKIEVSFGTLISKMTQKGHEFKFEAILHMPDALHKPIAVFRSRNPEQQDTKVILTDMVDEKGINLAVAIKRSTKVENSIINSIRSIYPKDSINGLYTWIREGLMDYRDKTKILDWLDKQQSNPTDLVKLIEDFANIVQR